MSLISFDNLNLKNKFKSIFPVEYEKAITYAEIIEDTLNLYITVSEFVVIMLISIYVNNSILNEI